MAAIIGTPSKGLLSRPTATTGLWSWLTTVDHKRIGIMYGVAAIFFFVIGGIEALVMRVQLARPDQNLIDPDSFNAMFTMHGTTMVFMFVMPAGAALFNYLVPLMIGARDVAFPRLNALSLWLFLFGSVLINFSFFMNAFPNVGWFGYAPLTNNAFTMSNATDYWVLGLQVIGLGTLVAGFNFVITILNMRAPGMTLMRMPLFPWMTLVVAFLIIFAFPPLTVALTMLMFDRFFGTNFFSSIELGSDPLLWQHLFWVFGHPEVYILILPGMGIVSDILPTFSRKPLFGYATIVFAGAVIAFLGFGVWAHHMFTVGMGPWANAAFSAATMTIAVPTGVKIFNWIATMYGGSISFKTPMLFAIGFISMFLLGGLSGIMHATFPVDSQQQDTYFIVAHFHYVLFGGAVFGLTAGLYYWFPKMTGRMLSERLGRVHFWLMLIGFNLTFMPMHFAGILGMPRRIWTYSADQNWEVPNMLATIGAFILAVSILTGIINVVRSLRVGVLAPMNPWGAPSLEWSIPSPPPPHNFDVVPTVSSAHPLWDEEGNVIEAPKATPEGTPHLPGPSYWPLVMAAAISFGMGGLIIWQAHTIAGLTVLSASGLVLLRSMYGWIFEPATPNEHAGAHH